MMFRILFLFMVLCVSSVSAVAQDTAWELNQTLNIKFGTLRHYQLDFPDGWQSAEHQTIYVAAEKGSDLARAFDEEFRVEGYLVSVEWLQGLALREMGINAREMSLNDALVILGNAKGFDVSATPEETLLVSWNALALSTTDRNGNHLRVVASYNGIEMMLVRLYAPTAEAMNEFEPTMDAILASARIIEGIVQLGDHFRTISCTGAGSPTVLLEPDNTGSSEIWTMATIMRIAEFTRVCTFDRKPYGDALHTFRDFAEDTHNMLERAGIASPYVLVGNDVGGQYARLFAVTYPDEVTGLVLVDSYTGHAYQQVFMHFASVIEDEDAARAGDNAYFADFGLDWEASIAEDVAVTDLGDLPLVVLVPENCWVGVTDELQLDWHRRALEEFSPMIASLSTQSEFMIISGTNHMTIISIPQPETIQAIRGIVEQAE